MKNVHILLLNKGWPKILAYAVGHRQIIYTEMDYKADPRLREISAMPCLAVAYQTDQPFSSSLFIAFPEGFKGNGEGTG